ncbi:MAG: Protein yceI precursor [Ignavibacteriae bacterium]|nr:MAG: Protein yceI precursor [Ignavibacteriota bacterium]
MKTLKYIFITILFINILSAQTVWKIDPVHSNVEFTVSHLVISDVTGRFKEFEGTLTHTKPDFTDAKIEAVINVKSVDTDNEKRDQHLLTPDFFNVEKFPTIKFSSKSVSKTGENAYKIMGDLTINGVTKPVTLEAKYRGQTTDPWGNVKSAFKATTSIDRFDYDVKWNAPLGSGGLVVGKTVDITLNIQLIKQK